MTSSTARPARIFEGLNYSFGNEDCSVEYELLDYHARHIATVCHSGTQLIPFLSKEPKAITFVDLSQEQLIIAKLRLQLLKTLCFEEYLRFWGYKSSDVTFRRDCIRRTDFEEKDLVATWLKASDWSAPLYIGKWDRNCVKLSRIYRALLGKRGLEIFDCTDLESQRVFLQERFPTWRFKLVINTAATLAATYARAKPSELPTGTSPRDFYREYQRIFNSILHNTLVQENFFFELVMLGEIRNGRPLEAQRPYYDKAKSWVEACEIEFVKQDVFSFLNGKAKTFDYVTLSNVTSYARGSTATQYLSKMSDSLCDSARVVVRNFLNHPEPEKSGYEDESESLKAILVRERTQVYTMSVYKKCHAGESRHLEHNIVWA